MNNLMLVTSGKAIKELFYTFKNEEVSFDVLFPAYRLKGLKALIHRLEFSRYFSAFVTYRSNRKWRSAYSVNADAFSEKDQNILIVAPGINPSREIDLDILGRFRNLYGVKLVLMLFDSLDSKSYDKGWNDINTLFPFFDLVLSYDAFDCKKYQLEHFFLPCKKVSQPDSCAISSDLFFVGNDKGRAKLLHRIADKASSHSVNCDLSVVDNRAFDSENHNVKHTYRRVPYSLVLSKVQSTNCVLEVLCEGQRSASMRYYEAISYNKKLLTNNKDVINMPFYNKDWIKVFTDVDDIDYEWIKRREKVDYGYDGEFDQEKLLDKVVLGECNE